MPKEPKAPRQSGIEKAVRKTQTGTGKRAHQPTAPAPKKGSKSGK